MNQIILAVVWLVVTITITLLFEKVVENWQKENEVKFKDAKDFYFGTNTKGYPKGYSTRRNILSILNIVGLVYLAYSLVIYFFNIKF